MNSNLLEGGKKVKKGYDATERKITITYFNSNNVSLPDMKVFSPSALFAPRETKHF